PARARCIPPMTEDTLTTAACSLRYGTRSRRASPGWQTTPTLTASVQETLMVTSAAPTSKSRTTQTPTTPPATLTCGIFSIRHWLPAVLIWEAVRCATCLVDGRLLPRFGLPPGCRRISLLEPITL